MVLQDTWSLMAVVSQDRFYCIDFEFSTFRVYPIRVPNLIPAIGDAHRQCTGCLHGLVPTSPATRAVGEAGEHSTSGQTATGRD